MVEIWRLMEDCSPNDALLFADSLDQETDGEPSPDDWLATMGFTPETPCDSAFRNDNMLAYGLALQAEFDNE